jgi:predicted O-methyltransferase YrrM
MTDEINQPIPPAYEKILLESETLGFTMGSDQRTCSLLRTLAASVARGSLLELGTGTGLSCSWILDGMDSGSRLISIENEEKYISVAHKYLSSDGRLELVYQDAEEWIDKNKHRKFDFIFADTWHGKFLVLNEVLSMLNKAGLYIIDDMMPQKNWPEGHGEKVNTLVRTLESKNDLRVTKLLWASGVMIAVKY